jgi:hypothetical protein
VIRALRGQSSGLADDDPGSSLVPFAWVEHSRAHEIFAGGAPGAAPAAPPLFSAYAHVAAAKPGAEVLARHPSENGPDGNEKAILLAVQRYGRGQSAVLASDALWRWKLNEPSTERGVERFWESLFAWLIRDARQGMYFDHPALQATTGQDLTLRLANGAGENLTVQATEGDQRAVLTEASPDAGVRVFHWTPNQPAFWEVRAQGPGGEARHWVKVEKAATAGEYSGNPPDEALLETMASRTAGAVLETQAPESWAPALPAGVLLSERTEAVWDRSSLFALMLGLYGSELILRRRWKLL